MRKSFSSVLGIWLYLWISEYMKTSISDNLDLCIIHHRDSIHVFGWADKPELFDFLVDVELIRMILEQFLLAKGISVVSFFLIPNQLLKTATFISWGTLEWFWTVDNLFSQKHIFNSTKKPSSFCLCTNGWLIFYRESSNFING